METKREMIKRALRGEMAIPEPRIVIIKIRGQSDAEAKKIAARKIKNERKKYFMNYEPGDEQLPILITALPDD